MSLLDETTRVSLPLALAAVGGMATLAAAAGFVGEALSEHGRRLAALEANRAGHAERDIEIISRLSRIEARLDGLVGARAAAAPEGSAR